MELDAPAGMDTERVVRDPRIRLPRLPPHERWLGSLGRSAEGIFRAAGDLSLIVWVSMTSLLRGQVPGRSIAREMYWMGVQSVPIILVTAVLSGFVTSQQGGYQFTGLHPALLPRQHRHLEHHPRAGAGADGGGLHRPGRRPASPRSWAR
jgi:hypothetical protein